MATSSAVSTGQQATATQYNNLRTDALARLQYTELLGTDAHNAAGVAGWEDWDVSGIVPAGTKAVVVSVGCSNSASFIGGARDNGSALNRYAPLPTGATSGANSWGVMLVTECDSNRVIEVYAGNTTQVWFNIVGYFWGE